MIAEVSSDRAGEARFRQYRSAALAVEFRHCRRGVAVSAMDPPGLAECIVAVQLARVGRIQADDVLAPRRRKACRDPGDGIAVQIDQRETCPRSKSSSAMISRSVNFPVPCR